MKNSWTRNIRRILNMDGEYEKLPFQETLFGSYLKRNVTIPSSKIIKKSR